MGIGVVLAVLGIGLLHLAYSSQILVIRTKQEINARCAADSGLVIAVWDMNENLLTGTWSTAPVSRAVEMGGSGAACTYTIRGDWPEYVIESIGICGAATKTVRGKVKAESFWKGIGVKDAVTINNNGVIRSTGQEITIRTNSGDSSQIRLRHGVLVPGDVIYGPTGSAARTLGAYNADIYGAVYAGEEIVYPPVDRPEIALTDTHKLEASTWTACKDYGGDTVDGGADPAGVFLTSRPVNLTCEGSGLTEGPGTAAFLTTLPGNPAAECADLVNWLGDTEVATEYTMYLTDSGISPYYRYSLSGGAIRELVGCGDNYMILNLLEYTQQSSEGIALTDNTVTVSDYSPTGKVAKWGRIRTGWDVIGKSDRISLRVAGQSGAARLSCFKLARENRAVLGDAGAWSRYRFTYADITGTLCIEGNVTLYCDAQNTADYAVPSRDCFVLNAGASLVLKHGASLKLYLGGDMDIKESSIVVCEDSTAKQFTILGLPYDPDTGAGCQRISLFNSSDLCAAVYAPDTAVHVGNDGHFRGSVVARSLTLENTGDFVYDASLVDNVEERGLAMFTLCQWWED
jgi:hypothetical protein